MSAISPFNYVHAAYTGKCLVLPANAQINPNTNKLHTISGRLIFSDDNRSIFDTKINFFAKNHFVKFFLGSATTNEKGEFAFQYAWKKPYLNRSHDIVMGIVEKRLPFARKGFNCEEEVVLQKIEQNIPANKTDADLGDILVSYANIPKNITDVKAPTASHEQPLSYHWKMFKAIAPEIPKKLFVSLFSRWLTASQVQKIYDSYGTQHPKRPNTPESLLDELLNQICAVDPAISENHITWTANWDGLSFDKDKSLPNVRVEAHKNEAGDLELDSIAIKFRDDLEEQVVKATESNLERAIYIARSVFALKGETEVHLSQGHILPGIIAKSFFKYIKPSNPLYGPAEPHLSQLDFINWLGSLGIIFGSGSVLDLSALDESSIAEMIIKTIRDESNWLNYSPPIPITKNHYHAKAEALHYNLLHAFFTKHIEENKEGIIKQWPSIFGFSESMRKQIDIIPPLATNENTPTELEIANLAKFMAWLISKTTFIHWAAHSRQQVLTDISQASISIENKALDKNGNFSPFGNTSAKNASDQLFIMRLLLNFDGDSFFKNPNGDMNQDLLKLFYENIANFEGYKDITDMHITTQI